MPPSSVFSAAPAAAGPRLNRRAGTETLLDLADHLPASERLLLEQVYCHGVRPADLARLAGRRPRDLHRRLTGLVRRLRCPLYIELARQSWRLPEPTRRVAALRVFEGRTLRQTAQITGLSLHAVRQHLTLARGLMRRALLQRAASAGVLEP